MITLLLGLAQLSLYVVWQAVFWLRRGVGDIFRTNQTCFFPTAVFSFNIAIFLTRFKFSTQVKYKSKAADELYIGLGMGEMACLVNLHCESGWVQRRKFRLQNFEKERKRVKLCVYTHACTVYIYCFELYRRHLTRRLSIREKHFKKRYFSTLRLE